MCGFNTDGQQTPTYLCLLSQSDLCFFRLLFQWIVFESISWVVAVSLTGRWEGKKSFSEVESGETISHFQDDFP